MHSIPYFAKGQWPINAAIENSRTKADVSMVVATKNPVTGPFDRLLLSFMAAY